MENINSLLYRKKYSYRRESAKEVDFFIVKNLKILKRKYKSC